MIGIMGLGLVHAMGKVGMIEAEAECEIGVFRWSDWYNTHTA
jgi:hypothetical protein